MKIGLYNDSFPPTIDGVAQTVINYANYITESNNEAVVVTPKYPNVIDNYKFKVLRYHSLKPVEFLAKQPYRVGNPFAVDTLIDLKRENFDIIHSHCPFASSTLANTQRGLELPSKRMPMIFTYHTKFEYDLDRYLSVDKFKDIAKKFILFNISRADEVWAVTDGAGKWLQASGFEGDYVVMPNGTDFPKGKASAENIAEIERVFRITTDETIFMFTGRMMWYKNTKIILDAMKLLKDSGRKFRLFMVGDGSDRPAIEKYARDINVYDRCIFTGAVYDREKMRAYYSRANLFLFPSVFDTSGLVVKEAAACGCASVLTKGSCASDGVIHGKNGLLAEENAEDFARVIADAIDANILEKLGNEASESIYFPWSASVQRAIKRYEYVIENYKSKQ